MSKSENNQELRALSLLAWPIVGTQLLQLTMQVIDSVLVGHLGVDPLAAIGMASAYYSILLCSCLGMLAALSPLISRASGRGDTKLVGHLFRQGWLLALVLSGVMIVGNYLSFAIFTWAGQPTSLLPMASEYLRTLSFGVPAHLSFVALRQFTEGTSNTRPSVIVASIGALLHVVVAYALVNGKFGLPALGTKGSAIGTSLAGWIMFLLLAGYTLRSSVMKKYSAWRGSFRPDWSTLREVFHLGAPMAAAWLCEVGFFSGTTIVAGRLGARSLAAHQIALNAGSFVFMVPLGLSFAVAIRVGQFAGRKDNIGVARVARNGLFLTVMLQLIPAFMFLFFGRLIAHGYTSDPDLIPLAAWLLGIAGLFQFFDGIQVVSMGILRGLKDTRVPFLNAIIAYWCLGMPLAYLLTFKFRMGTQGLWFGMVLGLAAASVLHWRRFQKVLKSFTLFSLREA